LIIEKFEFSTPLKGRGQCIENKGLFEFCEIALKIMHHEQYRKIDDYWNFVLFRTFWGSIAVFENRKV